MKLFKRRQKTLLTFVTALFLFVFQSHMLQAQLAIWPLRSGGANPPVGTTSFVNANATAGTIQVGSEITNAPNGSFNGIGLRIKLNNAAQWVTSATDNYHVDVPLSPKAGFDLRVTDIFLKESVEENAPTSFFIQAAYQVDGKGPFVPFSTVFNATAANTLISLTGLNLPLYNQHTYIIRLYFYTDAANNNKNKAIRVNRLVINGVSTAPATKPTVTTISATAASKYSCNTVSKYDTTSSTPPPYFQTVQQTGFVYSTAINTPTLTNGALSATAFGTNGNVNSTINGLVPGTNYFIQAYAITQMDTLYGGVKTCTTLPQSVPVLFTQPATGVGAYKATAGGFGNISLPSGAVVIDSGGLPITEKGVVYAIATVPSNLPTVTNATKSLAFPATGVAAYNNCALVNLTPNTKYYFRAYAKNSLGFGYGNLDSFTTSGPVPAITVNPNILNFGNFNYNSSSVTLSCVLTCNYFPNGNGNIQVNFPSAFQVSTNPSSGFTSNSPLIIPYTASSTNFKINLYVKLPTSKYGYFDSIITFSNSNVAQSNTDTLIVLGNVIPSADNLSNVGTEFWTGFGYMTNMANPASNQNKTAKVALYLASGSQSATVKIDIPKMQPQLSQAGWSFPRLITIPANSVVRIDSFPYGDINDEYNATKQLDCRLYYTGITNRAINIVSTNGVPISAWLYTYTIDNSAAGAMLFPTNTWTSNYTVQSFSEVSNASNPNSFFFVIAKEDGTTVTFKPSQDILDSSKASLFNDGSLAVNVKYKKDSTYSIVLNKGQVFNAMGFIQGNGPSALGLDLSGTTVSTTCDKSIAVFSGNGRCLVKTTKCANPGTGSDNMIQQMLPTSAWGTKYLTVPTKPMEYNLFRITVKDPTTIVKFNGTILTGLNTIGKYYQVESNQPSMFESDKPINVTQLITAVGSCGKNGTIGNIGNGDPEMIILSPVVQAIKSSVVASPSFNNGNTGVAYINVIIKKQGVATFKLDGSNTATVDTGLSSFNAANNPYSAGIQRQVVGVAKAFIPHPQDTNYYYAKLRVSYPAFHKIESDYPFNAISYGTSQGESYGFNAGTAINNISSVKVIKNPFGTDTSTSSISTCVGNKVTVQIAFPYPPKIVDSIEWNIPVDPNITDTFGNAPVTRYIGSLSVDPLTNKKYATVSDSIIVDGRKFYLYTATVPYKFNALGTYTLNATAYGAFSTDCGSIDPQKIFILVGKDQINYKAKVGSCGSTLVTFTDSSTALPGTSIKQWIWDFGVKNVAPITASTNVSQSYNYPAPPPAGYWSKLTTINSVGCISTDSLYIDLSGGLTAQFTVTTDTICKGQSVTFTAPPATSAGTFGTVNQWLWDFGNGPQSLSNTVTQSFNNTTTVKLTLKTDLGCTSNTADTNIVVKPKPTADFTLPAGVCLPGSTLFINKTDTAVVGPCTYFWNFGDNPAGTSIQKNPAYAYTQAPSASGYTVKMVATSTFGCASDTVFKTLKNVYAKPVADFTMDKTTTCGNKPVTFTDASTYPNQTISSWTWIYGDGKIDTLTVNPSTHSFSNQGVYPVKLVITTNQGCISDTSNPKSITITATPNIQFNVMPDLCLNGQPIAITQATELNGLPPGASGFIFSGLGVSGSNYDPKKFGKAGVDTITAIFTATNSGCSDTARQTIKVLALPTAYPVVLSDTLCERKAVSFTDSSNANGGLITNRTWIINGQTFKPTSSTPFTFFYNAFKNDTVKLVVSTSIGCSSDTASKVLVIHPKPVAYFKLPNAICVPPGIAQFTDSSWLPNNANPTLAYLWKFNDPNSTTSNPDTSVVTNPTHIFTQPVLASYPIQLKVTSLAGCDSTTSIALVTNNLFKLAPVAGFVVDTLKTCLGQAVTFTDTTSGNITKSLWSFGDGVTDTGKVKAYTYLGAGTFQASLQVTDVNGCTSENDNKKSILIDALPVVNTGNDAYVVVGNTTQFNPIVLTGNVIKYTWSSNGHNYLLNDSTSPTPVFTGIKEGVYNYTLTVKTISGCKATDRINVTVLSIPKIPNVFSPNGDGVHDFWQIGGLSNYPNCTVKIYNRYGQLIYNSIGYSKPWDGTSNGNPLPIGTYYYIISPKNGLNDITGSVTIIR